MKLTNKEKAIRFTVYAVLFMVVGVVLLSLPSCQKQVLTSSDFYGSYVIDSIYVGSVRDVIHEETTFQEVNFQENSVVFDEIFEADFYYIDNDGTVSLFCNYLTDVVIVHYNGGLILSSTDGETDHFLSPKP